MKKNPFLVVFCFVLLLLTSCAGGRPPSEKPVPVEPAEPGGEVRISFIGMSSWSHCPLSTETDCEWHLIDGRRVEVGTIGIRLASVSHGPLRDGDVIVVTEEGAIYVNGGLRMPNDPGGDIPKDFAPPRRSDVTYTFLGTGGFKRAAYHEEMAVDLRDGRLFEVKNGTMRLDGASHGEVHAGDDVVVAADGRIYVFAQLRPTWPED
ncbi:MAG: hypothetical protein JW958_01570 [Candidatus Eisenbacteria bacterium]|nr:hypothetical protein [Candidatus Eisenbacteria bacterium]